MSIGKELNKIQLLRYWLNSGKSRRFRETERKVYGRNVWNVVKVVVPLSECDNSNALGMQSLNLSHLSQSNRVIRLDFTSKMWNFELKCHDSYVIYFLGSWKKEWGGYFSIEPWSCIIKTINRGKQSLIAMVNFGF